jgi:hypothetical protein
VVFHVDFELFLSKGPQASSIGHVPFCCFPSKWRKTEKKKVQKRSGADAGLFWKADMPRGANPVLAPQCTTVFHTIKDALLISCQIPFAQTHHFAILRAKMIIISS